MTQFIPNFGILWKAIPITIYSAFLSGQSALCAENVSLEEGKKLVREICGTVTSSTVVKAKIQGDGGLSLKRQGVSLGGAVSLTRRDAEGLATSLASQATTSTDNLSKLQIECWRSQSDKLWGLLGAKSQPDQKAMALPKKHTHSERSAILRNTTNRKAVGLTPLTSKDSSLASGPGIRTGSENGTTLEISQQTGSIVAYNSFIGYDHVKKDDVGPGSSFVSNTVSSRAVSVWEAPKLADGTSDLVRMSNIVGQLLMEWQSLRPQQNYSSRRQLLDDATPYVNMELLRHGETWILDDSLKARLGG